MMNYNTNKSTSHTLIIVKNQNPFHVFRSNKLIAPMHLGDESAQVEQNSLSSLPPCVWQQHRLYVAYAIGQINYLQALYLTMPGVQIFAVRFECLHYVPCHTSRNRGEGSKTHLILFSSFIYLIVFRAPESMNGNSKDRISCKEGEQQRQGVWKVMLFSYTVGFRAMN